MVRRSTLFGAAACLALIAGARPAAAGAIQLARTVRSNARCLITRGATPPCRRTTTGKWLGDMMRSPPLAWSSPLAARPGRRP